MTQSRRSTVSAAASAPRKRFYKRVSVVAVTETPDGTAPSHQVQPPASNGDSGADIDQLYEVCLDHRRLRTPAGSVFRVPGHSLALAVAHEWDSADQTVVTSQMHVTGLCATVLDNPSRLTPPHIADKMAEHLHGDTILFPVEEPQALAEQQRVAWTPVVDWFRKYFKVDLEVSSGDCLTATIPPETCAALQRHLVSTLNMWSLTGLLFVAEALRSPLLALFALECRVLPAEVVALSRLEAEHQATVWGRVEWSHDVDQLDTEARTAAGLLVARLCSNTVRHDIVQKR